MKEREVLGAALSHPWAPQSQAFREVQGHAPPPRKNFKIWASKVPFPTYEKSFAMKESRLSTKLRQTGALPLPRLPQTHARIAKVKKSCETTGQWQRIMLKGLVKQRKPLSLAKESSQKPGEYWAKRGGRKHLPKTGGILAKTGGLESLTKSRLTCICMGGLIYKRNRESCCLTLAMGRFGVHHWINKAVKI